MLRLGHCSTPLISLRTHKLTRREIIEADGVVGYRLSKAPAMRAAPGILAGGPAAQFGTALHERAPSIAPGAAPPRCGRISSLILSRISAASRAPYLKLRMTWLMPALRNASRKRLTILRPPRKPRWMGVAFSSG